MSKRIIVLTIIALLCSGLSAISKGTGLLTEKYAGKYSYSSKQSGGFGEVIIYPETDSTVLFYLSVNRGEPTYNMGSLYGRLKVINGVGIFYKKNDYSETSCKWSIKFSQNKAKISTIDDQYECGFGLGVYSDGTFHLKKKGIVEYFTEDSGEKVYFKNTKPEDYGPNN